MSTHCKNRNWKRAFLRHLRLSGLVLESAQVAEVSRATVYRARDTRNRSGPDLLRAQTFARQWDDALEKAAEAIESEARRRAMEGIERQRHLFRNGEEVSTEVVRVYSDQLLVFLLKALRPERFGDKRLRQTSTQGNHDPALTLDELTQQRWNESFSMLLELPSFQAILAQANNPNPDPDPSAEASLVAPSVSQNLQDSSQK
jgi:hypothetical protein